MVARWLLSPLLLVVMVSSCFNHACDNKARGLNSFLWTVQRNPPAYLFGTIHVPYNRVWDWIPNNTKLAFTDTDSAIFELDLTNPVTLTALAECQMLPQGQSLSDYLPDKLYARLQQHLDYVRTSMPDWMSSEQKKKGLSPDYLFNAITGNWRLKRPVWVMLMVNSLTESDVRSRGIPVLDLYLAQHAERDGKVTGAVEKVAEQCVPLNQLNLSQVVFALNQTLSRHENFRALKSKAPCGSDALIHHYNCGDLNSLMFNRDTTKIPALVNSSLPPEDLEQALLIEDYFQKELIDNRNARMANRVAILLRQHPNTSFFFAFGAGHFLGNETVIDRLRRAGVDVVYTGPGENISRTHRVRHRQPQKARKLVLSDDVLQPSDVIYGDIQYFFAKRSRHDKRYRKERRKLQRAKKRQEQLDSLWENLDANSFNTKRLSKSGTKTKRKQRNDDRNNFNDLWVRTDQMGPRHLQQMGTSTFVQGNTKEDTNKEQQEENRQEENIATNDGHSSAIKLSPTNLASYCTTFIFTLCAMSSTLII